MKKVKKEEPVEMQIVRIRELSFIVNEFAFTYVEELSDLKLDYRTGFDLQNNFFDFTLRVGYYYQKSQIMFIQSEIRNVFIIKDLKKYVIPDNPLELNLPSNALITMVSLSLSHARAIISGHVAGTVYNDTILPIFNGIDVAKKFFGDRIKI